MMEDSTTTSQTDTVSLEKGLRSPVAQSQELPSQDSSGPPKDAIPNFPEGGFKAWLTVSGAAAALFVSFGWVNCIALFQANYEINQLKGYPRSTISWITSMEFFFMMFMSPVAGRLFDRYGPRVPLLIGTVLHVFGLMMASISTKYYQFVLSQSVCSGIGASFIFNPAMAAPQTYFREKRGLIAGLTVAGSSLGGVIFPLMVQHLLPSLGFGWTMRTCAFLILGMLVYADLTITSNLSHGPRPFKLMDYFRPLNELNFSLMWFSMFFLFCSFIGRTVPNYLGDRVGRFNVMIVMTLFSTILVLALWLPGRSTGAIFAFAALFGISSGAGIGLGLPLIAHVSPMKEFGFRMGMVVSIASIAMLTSPPIGGAIVARDGGSFTYPCVFSGVNFLISVAGYTALRIRLGGWKIAAKI
ncbi:monocarboxylate permease-like protein [Microsporum canis CBS 113480]|uniref:Monocarboxylate permease-like protein n=1 Tax=Arthroderma otae (strain ATCC MYA-4605 / CBS 113480) TaxID=554155 RepID=C5G0V2_ARTOC|nr:monocarboxylate permease-like protein [Microsporum canis CBS 113480]EEQ35755.1 monocarboxylate permease-like protein [Microsporum canis CBS 113480]